MQFFFYTHPHLAGHLGSFPWWSLSCTSSREMVAVEETTFLESVNSGLQLVMKNRKGPVKWLSRSRCLLPSWIIWVQYLGSTWWKERTNSPELSSDHTHTKPIKSKVHVDTCVGTKQLWRWVDRTEWVVRWGNLKWSTVPPWSKAGTR